MALGRISGPMLKADLERQGVDLSIDTDLLYIDVANNRVGINTATPATALDVVGSAKISALTTTRIPYATTGGLIVDSANLTFDGTNLRVGGVIVTPGGGAGVTDGDKGDITVSGTGATWTIDPGAVTLAKQANVATASILGRVTAAIGVQEVLTGTQATTLLDNFTSVLKGLVPASGGGTANFLRADGTWVAPVGIADGDKGDITVSASGATWTIDASAVTFAKMQSVATATILGRVSASTGVASALTGTQATTLIDVFTTSLKGLAPASGGGTTNFLRADGTWVAPAGGSLTDGDKGDITVSASGATWTIDAGAVTLAKQANIATASLLGRVTAATGVQEVLTGTQATTLLDNFTSVLKGLAPASGGGTTNFLRADGTWVAPTGTGGVTDGDKGDITVSGTGATWTIDPGAVTLAKQADVATASIMGRVTAATGVQEALTGTQATTLLNTFTTALKGLVPASGGGTVNFLRADGTFAAPGGGSGLTHAILVAVGDETTAATAGTAKVTFRMPYAFTLTGIRASVTTAPTGATRFAVDVNEGGVSVLSTKLTFDASEKTTVTSSLPPVISDANLADDAEITIDIDAVGNTIAGAGLKVYLIGFIP